MNDAARQVETELSLPMLRQAALPTVADQVFDEVQQRILSLELPPRTRISGAEVPRKMGVSRRPVREAFKRLARHDFPRIRPQSSTTIGPISEDAVRRARVIRTALEVHTCRTACETVAEEGLATAAALIDARKAAIEAKDRRRFHTLDDRFHREICVQAGVGYVRDLVHESKAHMDRIGMLSLNSSSQKPALEDHVAVFRAISARDPDAAATAVTRHLDRILVLIEEVGAQTRRWFEDEAE